MRIIHDVDGRLPSSDPGKQIHKTVVPTKEEKMKNWARSPIWISLAIVSFALAGCVQSQMAGSTAAPDPNKAINHKRGTHD